MSSLAVDWQGEYAPYDEPERWLPEFEKRGASSWKLGQIILANTGGQAAAERLIAGQDVVGFSYSNLAFEDPALGGGVGPRFDAVRATVLRPMPLANE